MTVDRVPDAVAVTADGCSLTYRQLDDAANRVARRLRSMGVEAGTAVGLRVGRTAAMAIGMLGILKAGAVYVPIDPSYPDDRIEHMLGEAEVAWLLDDHDVDGAEVRAQSAERVEIVANPDDLAYIMYTSGSTGRPKGVAVSIAAPSSTPKPWAARSVSPPKTSTSRPHRSRFPRRSARCWCRSPSGRRW